MLPILPAEQLSSIELQPWLLLQRSESNETSAALWNIDQVGEAIVIFSTYDKAEQYTRLLNNPTGRTVSARVAAGLSQLRWEIQQPTEIELGKLLVAGYQSGLRWVVLDPTASDAKLIYPLADVLKAFRTRLNSLRQLES